MSLLPIGGGASSAEATACQHSKVGAGDWMSTLEGEEIALEECSFLHFLDFVVPSGL